MTKAYTLSVAGLSLGMHNFGYELNNEFLDQFEQDLLNTIDIKVDLNLEKAERHMVLSFAFKGHFTSNCDRCLNPVQLAVDFEDSIIVRMDSQAQEKEDDDEIWWIKDETEQIDLSQYFYDCLMLQRPLRLICPLDSEGRETCDPKVLSLLEDTEETESSISTSPLSKECLEQLDSLRKLSSK